MHTDVNFYLYTGQYASVYVIEIYHFVCGEKIHEKMKRILYFYAYSCAKKNKTDDDSIQEGSI